MTYAKASLFIDVDNKMILDWDLVMSQEHDSKIAQRIFKRNTLRNITCSGDRDYDVPIFDKIFFDYNYHSEQSIELSAGSKKIKILIEPKYLCNYDTEIESYKKYDELLLIKSKDISRYSYNSCQNLDSKEVDSATHILIAK